MFDKEQQVRRPARSQCRGPGRPSPAVPNVGDTSTVHRYGRGDTSHCEALADDPHAEKELESLSSLRAQRARMGRSAAQWAPRAVSSGRGLRDTAGESAPAPARQCLLAEHHFIYPHAPIIHQL
eukprot:6188585-Pleurochrysis_carterae.AAC.9